MATWDPDQYERFAAARGRPFFDLVAQADPVPAGSRGVGSADAPDTVVDLGCGPGTLTATLTERWPQAEIIGIDNAPEMLDRAARLAGDRLRFERGDVTGWTDAAEPESVDVIVSNATMQWVADHVGLFPRWAQILRPGGWLGVQIPGNHDAPLHATLRELADTEPYAPHTAVHVTRFALPEPADYLRAAFDAGLVPDAWETTYQHVLTGPDPVFEWIKGTGARGVLQSLPADLLGRFEAEYKARLRETYPQQRGGYTVLPFRRVFVVARKPA